MHFYLQQTPEEFWKAHSKGGKPLGVTALIKELRTANQKDLAPEVERIRLLYGPDFDRQFTWKGTDGTRTVITTPCRIVKRHEQILATVAAKASSAPKWSPP